MRKTKTPQVLNSYPMVLSSHKIIQFRFNSILHLIELRQSNYTNENLAIETERERAFYHREENYLSRQVNKELISSKGKKE